MRMDVRRIDWIKDGTEQKGNRVKVKIVKNKVAPPFKEAEFDIMYGTGVSKSGCIIDLAVKAGIAQKSGAWFNYGDIKLGQGRENAKTFIEENPEIMEELQSKVLEKFVESVKVEDSEE